MEHASVPAPGPAAVARALIDARAHRRPCDAQPLLGALQTPREAYEAQALVARAMHGPEADVARFWKSGGPSREAVQTHAALPPEGVWASPADARDWPPFNFRLIEAEIALRLGREVSAKEASAVQTPGDALAYVDAMAVSIEIVDSRWVQGLEAPALLKLADLQSHGALVLGEWVPIAPRDWAAQVCRVQIGARAPAQWRGSHSMGGPAWVLPNWLRHATRDGRSAPAGTVVTTGTWCGMLPAAKGDLVVARFDEIGEARIQL